MAILDFAVWVGWRHLSGEVGTRGQLLPRLINNTVEKIVIEQPETREILNEKAITNLYANYLSTDCYVQRCIFVNLLHAKSPPIKNKYK